MARVAAAWASRTSKQTPLSFYIGEATRSAIGVEHGTRIIAALADCTFS